MYDDDPGGASSESTDDHHICVLVVCLLCGCYVLYVACLGRHASPRRALVIIICVCLLCGGLCEGCGYVLSGATCKA
jgi:hypothetical protein